MKSEQEVRNLLWEMERVQPFIHGEMKPSWDGVVSILKWVVE